MIALCPKTYYISNVDENDTPYANGIPIHYTSKGVSKKKNPLEWVDYYRAVNFGEVKEGTNINLNLHNNQMSKIIVAKKALTPFHTKYRVTEDFKTCIPLKTNCNK
jgi:hypothetical protein